MGKRRNWMLQGLFLLAVCGATAYGLLRGQDLSRVSAALRQADPVWCGAGCALVMGFICGEALVLHRLLAAMGVKRSRRRCVLYSFVGFFFSCVTPSAGGGQPAQVYFMHRDGVQASTSVPVMVLVTIAYKLVLVVFGLAALLIRPEPLWSALEPVRLWCSLGLAATAAVVGGYILLVVAPGTVEKLLSALLRGFMRLFPGLWGKALPQRFKSWMAGYRDAAACALRPGLMLKVFGLTVLQRSTLFAVTWCGMRAFGLETPGAVTVLLAQGMIALGTDILPLPGGMGANETMFLRIFPAFCGEWTLPVLLVSRGISYYGQLLLSAAGTGAAALILGKGRGKG